MQQSFTVLVEQPFLYSIAIYQDLWNSILSHGNKNNADPVWQWYWRQLTDGKALLIGGWTGAVEEPIAVDNAVDVNSPALLPFFDIGISCEGSMAGIFSPASAR